MGEWAEGLAGIKGHSDIRTWEEREYSATLKNQGLAFYILKR